MKTQYRTATSLRKSKGLFSKSEIAKILKVKPQVISDLLKDGRIPEPENRFCGSKRKYYTKAEAEKIISDLQS